MFAHILNPYLVRMTANVWLFASCALVGIAGTASGAAPAMERFRGGKVEWTRLETSDQYWNRHSDGDGRLLWLMHANTSLNIERTWHAARAADLESLCAYPFVYAADVSVVSDEEAKNLVEYLKRGGFLFVDCCINASINKDPRVFLQRQTALLTRHWPELRVVELESKHPVFSIYFHFENGPPMTREVGSWSMTENFPLWSLIVGDQVVGMISLSGLQCAWSGVGVGRGRDEQPLEAMKMATNIYLYAMSR
jgi:hypothetical protein